MTPPARKPVVAPPSPAFLARSRRERLRELAAVDPRDAEQDRELLQLLADELLGPT